MQGSRGQTIAEDINREQTKATKLREAIFGDVVITLWREFNGNLYVSVNRGMPQYKVYSCEDFLTLESKFRLVADRIEGL